MPDLTDFYQYLIENDRKPITARKSCNCMRLVFAACDPTDYSSFYGYLISLKEKGYKGTYINTILFSTRQYLRFKGINVDEIINIKKFKEVEVDKGILSSEEILSIINIPKPQNTNQAAWDRWSFFFEILSMTGLRPGELAKMNADKGDVDFGRNVFIVRAENVKTNTSRLVPIPPPLIEKLTAYIRKNKCGYLFPSLRGGNKLGAGPCVDNVDWHYNFTTRLKRLGIKRPNVSLYSLRHSFITELLTEGANYLDTQRVVGHVPGSKITSHYYKLNTKALQRAVAKHTLIRNQTDPHMILASLKETIEAYNLQENKKVTFRLEESSNGLLFQVTII
jgi:integrase